MNSNVNYLKYIAYKLRVDSLRATSKAGSGHPTSCLSAADIIAVLFFDVINYNLSNPKDPRNDRFILSKGHAAPLIYAAWKHLGVLDDKELLTLRDFNSTLEGHPTPRFIYNEGATGSLGMGLSMALGQALSSKINKLNFYVYTLLGDSELTEGSIWEAVELAGYYCIDNLIAIVDLNGLGQSVHTIDDHHVDSLSDKFKAFKWNTIKIDGHSIEEIIDAFKDAKNYKKPVVIIAKTYKGYGLKDIQNKNGYHGKAFSQDLLPELLNDLKEFFKPISYLDYLEKDRVQINLNLTKDNIKKIYIKNPDYKISDMVSTRYAFANALNELGKLNDKVVVLDAEVKNSTYTEIFQSSFPERFIECFIAEQNMTSIAVGLEERGLTPFIATFGAFLTRAHDQIRMASISRSRLKIAGTHAGISIGQDGPSQMALEDIAMFRSIANSIVLYPSDAVSAYKLLNVMFNYDDGISYIRLTRANTPVLYDNNMQFKLGGCNVLFQSNNDVLLLVSAGITLFEAIKAYSILKDLNINVCLIDLYSIKPLDISKLLYYGKKSGGKIIVIEDHYLQGGISESIAYNIVNHGIKLRSLHVSDIARSGSMKDLLRWASIDSNSIVKEVKDFISK